jgi:4-oxalocrotonate tautomerase
MPIVHIELLEGRSIEQKREMVKKVTDAIVETTACPVDAVRVVLCEMPQAHLSEGGVYAQTDSELKKDTMQGGFRPLALYQYFSKIIA